jgi:hypothetical protein
MSEASLLKNIFGTFGKALYWVFNGIRLAVKFFGSIKESTWASITSVSGGSILKIRGIRASEDSY